MNCWEGTLGQKSKKCLLLFSNIEICLKISRKFNFISRECFKKMELAQKFGINKRVKMVDFSFIPYFWASSIFFGTLLKVFRFEKYLLTESCMVEFDPNKKFPESSVQLPQLLKSPI